MIRRAIPLLAVAFLAVLSSDQAPLPPGVGPVPFSKYGAGGSPGIDATAAFAAIRADPTSPTVFLPPGQYEIAGCPAAPYFASNVTLVGAGAGRTRIKVTGPACAGTLFAWGGGRADFGARDLTIDWNGAACTLSVGVCAAFYITNNTRARIENVAIVETTGDNWFHIHVVGSTHGLIRRTHVQPRDCNTDWNANTGLMLGSTYALASRRTGAIAGNVLTVTGKTSGSAITVGQAVTGAGVPRGVVIAALGTGTGDDGTYILDRAVPNPVASGPISTVSSHGWTVERNRFVHTNVSIDSPMQLTRDNEIGPYCAGPGMNTSSEAAHHTSIGDLVHDGPSVAGDDDLFDTGLEFHGPDSLVVGSRVSNVSSACLSFSGARTIIQGGACERFDTGALQDAAFTGSVSGTVLTVTGVTRGLVQRGQLLTGPGLTPAIITKGGSGTGGVGTYHLLKAAAPTPVSGIAMTANLHGSYAGLFASNGDDGGANSIVAGYTVRGSGSAGEKICFSDNPTAKGIVVRGVACAGISDASPYRILGDTTVAGPGTLRAKRPTVPDDGSP